VDAIVIVGVLVGVALAALRWGADSRDPVPSESLAAWAAGRAGAKQGGATTDGVE